jgi:glycosyltransferase involved in cell wall biosynthesis
LRLLVFSERLGAPYDEGIKSLTSQLACALAVRHDVLKLTTASADDERQGIRNVETNRLLLSPGLRSAVRGFGPEAIVYVPTACGTFFAFARARALRSHGGHALTALLTLQPRPHTAWDRWGMRRLTPDLVVAQSRRTVQTFGLLGCRTALLPPAVDAQRFRPSSAEEKASLRAKYGLPASATILTHAGHLRSKRNLTQMLALQGVGSYHVLIVASSSTAQEAPLLATIRASGATAITEYVPTVEDIYRLSDAYLFLAEEDTAAIEMPLSVLEAMACNLPIVCTRFGGLPDFFQEGRGVWYWDGRRASSPALAQSLQDAVQAALASPCQTRALVESRTWVAAADGLVAHLSKGPGDLRTGDVGQAKAAQT